MNLDLKKSTKYREKETFNHLLTVLMCMFGQMENYQSEEKAYEKRLKQQNKIYKEVKEYLASYIKALKL